MKVLFLNMQFSKLCWTKYTQSVLSYCDVRMSYTGYGNSFIVHKRALMLSGAVGDDICHSYIHAWISVQLVACIVDGFICLRSTTYFRIVDSYGRIDIY